MRAVSTHPKKGLEIPPGNSLFLILFLVTGLSTLGAPLQSEPEWYASYMKAVDEIKKGEKDDASSDDPLWASAIQMLESAVAAEAEPAREKTVGRKKEKYFPYYYLAIAYLRTGDLTRAREYFAKAEDSGQLVGGRRFMIFGADESKDLERYQAELHFRSAEDLFAKEQFVAAGKALDQASQGNLSNALSRQVPALQARLQTALAAQRERFEGLVREANQAAERDDLATAAAKLDEAAVLDEDEFVKRGLRIRRDEIDRTIDLLLRQAQTQESEGQLTLAKQTLQRALSILPSRGDVGRALDRAVGRERTYTTALAAAWAASDANDPRTALGHFEEALSAHPEWAIRDGLALRLEELTSSPALEHSPSIDSEPDESSDLSPGEGEPAIDPASPLESARSAFDSWQTNPTDPDLLGAARAQLVQLAELDFDSFQEHGRELLDEMSRVQGDAFEPESFRQAVRALFFGSDLETAVGVLEQLRATGGVGNAALHAFLGVSYLKAAVLSLDSIEASGLREKGLRQFRLVRGLHPDFELPARLVSPLIRKLFEETQP